MNTEFIERVTFPILFETQGDEDLFTATGTGFFINDSGLFMTAGHVIENSDPDKRLVFAGTEKSVGGMMRFRLCRTGSMSSRYSA